MAVKKLLLIDDDAELCAELAEMLRGEGYDATWVSDSYQGEAFIRCRDFDAILLDFKMPLATGLEILARMKSENLKCPVLLISGRSFVERELEAAGLSGMVSAVLSKPIDPDLLLEKLKTLRRR